MIRNKTIKFNLDKQEDRELWEWLQGLPHGLFSELTKKFWEEKKSNSYKHLEEQIKSGEISMVFGHDASSVPHHNFASEFSKEPIEDRIKKLKEDKK